MTRVRKQVLSLRDLIGDAEPPETIISAGLGCGRECEMLHGFYPEAAIYGFEPNAECRSECEERIGRYSMIFPMAVTDRIGKVDFHNRSGNPRASSIFSRGNEDDTIQAVPAVTLDHLDEFAGPFNRVLLWLDCEGSELLALYGASHLIARDAIKWINVEMRRDEGDRPGSCYASQINQLLKLSGFIHHADMATYRHGHDSVYYHESFSGSVA